MLEYLIFQGLVKTLCKVVLIRGSVQSSFRRSLRTLSMVFLDKTSKMRCWINNSMGVRCFSSRAVRSGGLHYHVGTLAWQRISENINRPGSTRSREGEAVADQDVSYFASFSLTQPINPTGKQVSQFRYLPWHSHDISNAPSFRKGLLSPHSSTKIARSLQVEGRCSPHW